MVRAWVEIFCKFFSALIFISVLLGLKDFSVFVILCSSQIVVANRTLNAFICLYYPELYFHERVAMTLEQI